MPKSVWETVSAFANTRGGKFLLGVDGDRTVLGLADPERFQADLAGSLHQVLTP